MLTISGASLTHEHLIAAGADPDTPVVGTEAGREFTRAILGDEARLDAAAAERDILDAGDTLMAQYPETGAVLLECTNMVPYARALSEHLRLPVFSIYSFVSWFQAGLVPRDFGPTAAALDDRVGAAVGQPPRRPEPLRVVRVVREDAIDLRTQLLDAASLLRTRRGNQRNREDGNHEKATHGRSAQYR